jgi:predicted ArsR family transcriptional regulator
VRSEHPPVRDSDPFTSWAVAYRDIGSDMKLRTVIEWALRKFGPMTHDELIAAVGKVRLASPSGVRTRVSEMVEDGVVERVPNEVAKSAYGRAALLWRLK